MDVRTRQQLWKDMFGEVKEKSAELAGTYDMPGSPPKREDKVPLKNKEPIQKTASAEPPEEEMLKEAFLGVGISTPVGSKEHQKKWGTRVSVGFPYVAGVTVSPGPLKGTGAGVGLGMTGPMLAYAPSVREAERQLGGLMKEQPDALPQAKTLKPKVDVSGQEPPKVIKNASVQHYALPSQGRYPLDGYDQVKTAAAYFEEWYKQMPPSMRREYCHNLVKRASALGIPVSELAERYGSDSKARAVQIKIAFDARRSVLKDENHIEVLDKLAAATNTMDPEFLATTLTEFDRMAGLDEHWGGDIPDPYFSAFEKTAEGTAPSLKKKVGPLEQDVDPGDSIIIGNEYVTQRELAEFAKHNQDFTKERYGDDFAKEFAKDPMGIFDSLPRDQKLVIMRMANNSDSNTFGASTS